MPDLIARHKLLGETPVLKLLIKFSIPSITGMLVNALYNVVDRIFIGKEIGGLAIGGLYITTPFMFSIMAFGLLVGIGGNSLVSILLGENRKHEADEVVSNAFSFLLIMSVLIGALGVIFLKDLLMLFGANDQNFDYAYNYMHIIFLATPLQMLSFGMNPFIRGEGNPNVAMYTMLIGAIVNIIFDYLFIVVLKLGVEGAALATTIGYFCSMIWVLAFFFRKKSIMVISFSSLRPKLRIFKKIAALGFSPFAMTIASSLVIMILNLKLQEYGGEYATACMGVINAYTLIFLMPVLGISQGSQPIIGYNYGAKNFSRVRDCLKYAITSACFFSTIASLLALMFPTAIYKVFLSSDANFNHMLEIGVPGMRIVVSFFFIVGPQIICTNYFLASGKPKQAMILSLLRQVILLIPAFFILPLIFNLTGVWMSWPFADALSAILTFSLFFRSIKNMEAEYKSI